MSNDNLKDYKLLDQRTHVLTRPNMYVGSLSLKKEHRWIINDENKFDLREVEYSPALIKLFDEIITNSADEHIRSGNVTEIRVDVDKSTSKITVSDNGGIPVKKHPDHDMYVPEMIFGHLMAGSNFDDDDRTTGGMNGLGSKLSAIFSTNFKVDTADGQKRFIQTFYNNLSEKSSVNVSKSKDNGTTITFVPDFDKLKCELTDDNISLIKSRVYDIAGCYPLIRVFWNNELIRVNRFQQYCDLHQEGVVYDSNNNWSVCVGSSSEDMFSHVSFVNGINTHLGGSHVDYVTNLISYALRDYIKKKYKVDLRPNNIKQQLFVFVNCSINAPQFTSQTKEMMIMEHKDFSTKFELTDKFLNKIIKTDVVQNILEWAENEKEKKERRELKKLENKKKIKSEKYHPATKNKKILFACEGASAAGSAIPSFGREDYGYYELKGKPLNCSNASVTKFKQNNELSELYSIINNEEYDYFIAFTDQDLDGSSIRMLLVSFVLEYLPEYKGRFGYLDTPVIVVKNSKGKIVKWYYSLRDKVKLNKGESIQYYKGLGTWDYEDLQYIIQRDGIENMIKLLDFENEELYRNWLNENRVDVRKEQIVEHEFSIANL